MGKARMPITQRISLRIKKAWTVITVVACLSPFAVQAQNSDSGPIPTASGALQFVQQGRDVMATLDAARFDHFPAMRLTHFDDIGTKRDVVQRMLVETDAGPVLYDFRRRPPLVQTIALRMTVRRVFWQGEEVILQGSKGWYRFEHGTLTKLQATKTTYH